jgi:hypothetical protein
LIEEAQEASKKPSKKVSQVRGNLIYLFIQAKKIKQEPQKIKSVFKKW